MGRCGEAIALEPELTSAFVGSTEALYGDRRGREHGQTVALALRVAVLEEKAATTKVLHHPHRVRESVVDPMRDFVGNERVQRVEAERRPRPIERGEDRRSHAADVVPSARRLSKVPVTQEQRRLI